MTAVREHGTHRVDDPDRLADIDAVGVDETAFQAAAATRSTSFARVPTADRNLPSLIFTDPYLRVRGRSDVPGTRALPRGVDPAPAAAGHRARPGRPGASRAHRGIDLGQIGRAERDAPEPSAQGRVRLHRRDIRRTISVEPTGGPLLRPPATTTADEATQPCPGPSAVSPTVTNGNLTGLRAPQQILGLGDCRLSTVGTGSRQSVQQERGSLDHYLSQWHCRARSIKPGT
jgi:hypothetical protein